MNFAAKYGLEKQNMNRILIFDLNFYKSNEVKHMFYDDPRVLHISMNCFDQGSFSPEELDSVDSGAGKGKYTIF